MTIPRDPRARRRDPLTAALRLEVAADAMRAHQLEHGPDIYAGQAMPIDPAATAESIANGGRLLEAADDYAEQLAAIAMAPPLEPPPPVASLTPVDGAPAAAPSLDTAPAGADTVEGTPAPPGVAVGDHTPARPVFSNEHRRRTDWVSAHDPRSLSFGIRPRLAGSAPITDVMLPAGPVFDQGTEGSCFGMAATAAVNAMRLAGLLTPASPLLSIGDALKLYKLAQRRDERPGQDYDGTSVTGGMRALREESLVGGYLWSFGTRDIAQTLLHGRGAVIVGVPWLSGMFETGPGGLVELRGDDVGLGHCLAVLGIRKAGPQGQPGPYFIWQNSYGPGYGDNGFGYIHHRDLAELLHGSGEAAIPTAEAQTP
jgi:hypothetical protein